MQWGDNAGNTICSARVCWNLRFGRTEAVTSFLRLPPSKRPPRRRTSWIHTETEKIQRSLDFEQMKQTRCLKLGYRVPCQGLERKYTKNIIECWKIARKFAWKPARASHGANGSSRHVNSGNVAIHTSLTLSMLTTSQWGLKLQLNVLDRLCIKAHINLILSAKHILSRKTITLVGCNLQLQVPFANPRVLLITFDSITLEIFLIHYALKL